MGTAKRKIDNKLFANEGAQSAGTERNAPYGLDKFFSLCYHHATSVGA